jgi:hypothetical protein
MKKYLFIIITFLAVLGLTYEGLNIFVSKPNQFGITSNALPMWKSILNGLAIAPRDSGDTVLIGATSTSTNSVFEVTGSLGFTSYNSCTALETDANGLLVCGVDDMGSGGGGGDGYWATTTNDLAVHPINSLKVLIGGTATTTSGYKFEVIGSSLFDDFLGVNGTTTNFRATNLSVATGLELPNNSITDAMVSNTLTCSDLVAGSAVVDISSETNLSVTATGIELSGDAIALTTGYSIPKSASTTAWEGFYDTPSGKITAGDLIDWSGATLNVALNLDDVTNVDLTGAVVGSLLGFNGSNWVDVATSTLHIALSDTTGILEMGSGGTGQSLADPDADKILFWDDNPGAMAWLSLGTGLSFSGTNLVVSSGYGIPLTASTTAWEAFKDTPSGIIIAGDHIDWTGNTLNVLDDWYNSIADLPTAAVTNGDTTHISTADQIYDFVIGLGYSVFGSYIDATEMAVADFGGFSCNGTTCTIDDAFLLNNGDVGTGAYDFGGTTDFEIENGVNPTVDTAGEISVDTSATSTAALRFYADASYQIPGYYTKTLFITSPTADGDGAIWRVPYNITIKNIHYLCTGGTNWIGQLDEMDANGANAAVVDGDVTATAGTNANDDGTLSNPTIDAGDYLGVHTTSISGTPTRLLITIEYVVDATN